MLYIELLSNLALFLIFIKVIFLFFSEKGIGMKLTFFTFAINILTTITILDSRFISSFDIKNVVTNIILLALIAVLVFISRDNRDKNG